MTGSSYLFKLIITATADSGHVLILIAVCGLLWQEQLPISHLLILTATTVARGHPHRWQGLLLLLKLRDDCTLHCLRPLWVLSRWGLGLPCHCRDLQGLGGAWWCTGSCVALPLLGAAV